MLEEDRLRGGEGENAGDTEHEGEEEEAADDSRLVGVYVEEPERAIRAKGHCTRFDAAQGI